VIIATDIHINMDRFGDKPVYAVSTSDAIRKTRAVIEEALAKPKRQKRLKLHRRLLQRQCPQRRPADASKFLVASPLVLLALPYFYGGEGLRKAAKSWAMR